MISAPSILVVTKSRFRFAAYYIKLVARNLSKRQCVYRSIPRNTTAWQLRKKQVSFFGTSHVRLERCLISHEEKQQLKVIWIAKLICSWMKFRDVTVCIYNTFSYMTRLFRVKLSLIMVILIYHKNKETFLLWLQLKTWGSFLEIRYFSFVNLSV